MRAKGVGNMYGNPKRERWLALALSLLINLGLVLVLYLLRLDRLDSAPEEVELVLVALGDTSEARGEQEPEGQEVLGGQEKDVAPSSEPIPSKPREPQPRLSKPQPAPNPKPSAKPREMTQQPIRTQQHEESLALARQREAEARRQEDRARLMEQERIRAEETQRQAAEARRQAEEVARRRAGASVSNAFSSGRGQGTSQGSSNSGVGREGNPKGSAGSYSLVGRTIVSNGGQLSRPSTQKAIRGRVGVRIVVDATGAVVEANIDPKTTNISDAFIRSAALSAARSTRFNAQEGANEQKGLITYDFDIQ